MPLPAPVDLATAADAAKTFLYIGGGLVSVVGAYFTLRAMIRYGLAAVEKDIDGIKARLTKLDSENSKQWQKTDAIDKDLAQTKERLQRIDVLLDPAAVRDHQKEQADMRAEVRYLRRDVDELRAGDKK